MPSQVIQWFPGHMAKTRRMMKECLGEVDIILELLDARIPYSSKNPEIARICANKPTLILLNKASLADASVNRAWLKYFEARGEKCLLIRVIFRHSTKLHCTLVHFLR